MAIEVTREMVTAAWGQVPGVANRVRVEAAIRAALALLPDDEPRVTIHGLDGPGVRDAGGSVASIPVHRPQVLAGVAEIAARCGVARPTVSGWVKAAPGNGMPEPIVVLAAGPVYDLEAVAVWHAARTGGA